MKEKDQSEQKKNKDGASDTPIYLTGNSTLQTPEEDRHDKSMDPRKDDTFEPSNDDLHETPADRTAGSDRAGTSERKP
jgi:hypothetical protein